MLNFKKGMLNFKTYFCSKCGGLSDPLAMCLCSQVTKTKQKCHEVLQLEAKVCLCKDKAYQIFILLVDIENGPNVAEVHECEDSFAPWKEER